MRRRLLKALLENRIDAPRLYKSGRPLRLRFPLLSSDFYCVLQEIFLQRLRPSGVFVWAISIRSLLRLLLLRLL